jgi:transcriptional regulator with XRE-family HTH domain
MTTPQGADDSYDGNWVRMKRLELRLYQHQLAAKLDINQGRISEWETGFRRVPSDIVSRIKSLSN